MLEFDFPAVMGILNVTPDSFSDGGRYFDKERAIAHALDMVEQGAAIIDIGGESTRPGAERVSTAAELERTIPVIEAIRARSSIPLSIDTSNPEVMTAAAAAGVNMINDVRALRREGALEAAAQSRLPVCLMHMQGEPATMQDNPRYDDLLGDISRFLVDRMEHCEAAGISIDRVLLDPGFGFGKTFEQNLVLLNRLDVLVALGRPVMVGMSRKSAIGRILGEGVDRLHGSVAGALTAVSRGAAIVRVHDVAPTVQGLKVLTAIERERSG